MNGRFKNNKSEVNRYKVLQDIASRETEDLDIFIETLEFILMTNEANGYYTEHFLHFSKDLLILTVCKRGHTKILTCLLERFKWEQIQLKESLIWSAKNGSYEIFKILIEHGADIRGLNKVVFYDFANIEKINIILFLIANKIKINTNIHFLLRYLRHHGLEKHNRALITRCYNNLLGVCNKYDEMYGYNYSDDYSDMSWLS